MARHNKGLVVSFKHDISEREVERLKAAILEMKNVSNVDICPTEVNDHLNRKMVSTQIKMKIYEALNSLDKN